MTLEHIEDNKATMRSNIDSIKMKIYPLLETMVSLAHKKSDTGINVEARRIVAQIGSSSLNIPGVTNPKFGFVRPEEGHIPILIPTVHLETLNHYAVSARHGSVTDDED